MLIRILVASTFLNGLIILFICFCVGWNFYVWLHSIIGLLYFQNHEKCAFSMHGLFGTKVGAVSYREFTCTYECTYHYSEMYKHPIQQEIITVITQHIYKYIII